MERINEDFTNLYNRWKGGKSRKEDNYEYVDLGLPSGLLWAKCNLGASNEFESGDFFCWGETEPKDEYTYNNYTCETEYYRHDVIKPEDDAAHVNMGGDWRLPTKREVEELYKFTSNKDIDDYQGTGINVTIFTQKGNRKKNKPTLIIPRIGYMLGDVIKCPGEMFMLLTANLGDYKNKSVVANPIFFGGFRDIQIYIGCTVRGVKNKE